MLFRWISDITIGVIIVIITERCIAIIMVVVTIVDITIIRSSSKDASSSVSSSSSSRFVVSFSRPYSSTLNSYSKRNMIAVMRRYFFCSRSKKIIHYRLGMTDVFFVSTINDILIGSWNLALVSSTWMLLYVPWAHT